MSAPVVALLDARPHALDDPGLRELARVVGDLLGRTHVSRSYRYPYALVAGHDADVGVDVERIEPVDRRFVVSIATPDERAALAAGEADDDLSAWAAALWSGKEALAKALGDALAYDPRRLDSPLRWPGGRAGVWRAARVPVPADHTGWLCWRAAADDTDDPGAFVMQDAGAVCASAARAGDQGAGSTSCAPAAVVARADRPVCAHRRRTRSRAPLRTRISRSPLIAPFAVRYDARPLTVASAT